MSAVESIIDLLEHDERVSGWQLREIQKRSQQLFLNKDREEGRRKVESLIYEVEVLVTRRADVGTTNKWVTGNAKFNIDPSGLGMFAKSLENALISAELVQNESYGMTEVGGLIPQVQLSDPSLEKDPLAVLTEGASQVCEAAAKEAQVRLSAAEFFAESFRTRFFNSQGISALQESTLYSGEVVLLAQGDGGAESEVFRAFKRRRLGDCALASLVATAASQSRRRTGARLPRTGDFDVVFSGEALDHFFSWFVSQSSAAARYNRHTQAELGAELALPKPGATPLTLFHNATLPWAVGSYKVDPSGSAACRRLLIDGGRLKSRWASSRYAQYLKIPASGELGNIEVEPGKAAAAELLTPEGGRPLYHLNDFSYFEPNGMTGEFSAEIRFGEDLSDGAAPLKGGSVSGLSSSAVSSARFSAETEQRERYNGPKYIRCERLTLAGA